MDQKSFDALRIELSVKAKNGIDFIVAASIVWLGISYLWTLDTTAHTQSILTFCVGAVLLPLAGLLSKVFNTTWKINGNPLEPLGLWLNFAQLFYFPFLFFILAKMPEYFVMVYAIITGAHFFPYSWYYKNTVYAISAGIISVGSWLLGIYLPANRTYVIPLLMSLFLAGLAILLYVDYKKKVRQSHAHE